jgi:steroid delta-isomerase-like uncharacterized protein
MPEAVLLIKPDRKGANPMSVEQNKALVQRLYEDVWNRGQLGAADEICAADYVYRDPVGPNMRELEAYKELVTYMRNGFPDLQFIVKDLIAEGDKVVARFTFVGTHEKALPQISIAPSGKRVEFEGASIYRIVDGKIAEVLTFRERIDLKLGAKIVLP